MLQSLYFHIRVSKYRQLCRVKKYCRILCFDRATSMIRLPLNALNGEII